MQSDPEFLATMLRMSPLAGHSVIRGKLFHHNNLILHLLFDPHFEVYLINVHRINNGENADLWGIFDRDDLERAITKFESIKL